MTQDSIQLQAKALGDPTRHRIFRYIADAEHAVDVGELTDHLGLNHNAIRQHLLQLVETGLVARRIASAQGRGRPRQLFEVHPAADERWGVGGPYRRVSLVLIEMLHSGDGALEVGRRAGKEAAAIGKLGGERAVEELGEVMRSGGFDPLVVSGHDSAELVFRHCPYADAASADPDTVCALHLGLAQGLAGNFEGLEVDELKRHDPRRAGCRLRFRVEESDTVSQ
jgi:predicted ArsR family transcriptional regulator